MLATEDALEAAIWPLLHFRTLLLAAVTFLLLANYLKTRRPKNYPPGPWRLPFVGNLLQLDLDQPHIVIQQVRQVWVSGCCHDPMLSCKTEILALGTAGFD